MRTLSAAVLVVLTFVAQPAVADRHDVTACVSSATDPEERYEACTRVLRDLPDLPPVTKGTLLMHRAGALVRLGRHAEALADLNRAIVYRPRDAGLHAVRGQVLSHLGRYPAALADANRAVALAPGQAVFRALRGEIHEKLGRRDLALADFRAALALDPNESRAAAGVARLSGTPSGPPAGRPQSDEPSLTFRILKRTSVTVRLAFYAQSRSYAWPGNNRYYTLSQNTETHYSVACREGERICYGAWTVDDDGDEDLFWGVGKSNGHACSNCCYVCNGIRTEVIPLDP